MLDRRRDARYDRLAAVFGAPSIANVERERLRLSSLLSPDERLRRLAHRHDLWCEPTSRELLEQTHEGRELLREIEGKREMLERSADGRALLVKHAPVRCRECGYLPPSTFSPAAELDDYRAAKLAAFPVLEGKR
jgi:predicted Zn-ribbon and HTH transcriptional regulator